MHHSRGPPSPSKRDDGGGDSHTPNNTRKNRRSGETTPTSPVRTPKEASLINVFECPVCYEYVQPPILQCESGHLVCSTCKPKLNNICPTCRGELGTIRNLALEKIAEFTSFPCKYYHNGCKTSLPAKARVEHEKQCGFRQYKCPCPGANCKWTNTRDKIMEHLTAAHPVITTLQGEDIIFLATELDIDLSMDWVMMQSCFGHNFMLVLQKHFIQSHAQYYIQVIMMGSRHEAERFTYKVELRGSGRRLSFESGPKSLDDLNTSDTFKKDCLHFDAALAALFIDRSKHHMNIAVAISTNDRHDR